MNISQFISGKKGVKNIFYHLFAMKDLKPTVRRDCFSSRV